MTTFYLVRHGENDLVTHRIAGRQPGVHLNEQGKQQAVGLAERLDSRGIQQILSSCMERAQETAEPLAQRLGLPIQLSEALLEVEFGDWTGKTFAELDQLPEWKRWNSFRSASQIPNGERMLEVQRRVVGEINRLHQEFPRDTIALFSHGDPLRSAIVYYLGMPLDFILRVQLRTASVTILNLTESGVRVERVNWQTEL